MGFSTIVYEKSNGVATITLNRPEKLNSFNTEMRKELDLVFSELIDDTDTRVTLITGSGKAFCAGADIDQFVSGELGKDAAGGIIMRHMIRSIENCPQPVIAAINGYALGGGLEIALACDLRIASDMAEFGLTESNLGAIPGAGGTQRLPRVVGVAKAKEMIFLGKRITAEEAGRIGLVHMVVPHDNLMSESMKIIETLKEKSPISLACAKAAINKVWEFTDLDSGLVWERDLANLCTESFDRQEGMRAFVEKRKPKFTGK